MSDHTPTLDEARFEYALRLGDSALILGHRVSEWCGHGPVLEQDIALTNVALDLIGQARSWLTYAGEIEGEGRSEDDLAYRRDSIHFRNLLLAEQANGDFAVTIGRQFLFDAFMRLVHERMAASADEHFAAIAAKSLKEATYHERFSSEWVIRLGDGTDESKSRMQRAIDDLWRYTGEMFAMDAVDRVLVDAGIAPDLAAIQGTWSERVDAVLAEATLARPEDGWMASGGKTGQHGESLGYILADMQFLQRAYPGAEW